VKQLTFCIDNLQKET